MSGPSRAIKPGRPTLFSNLPDKKLIPSGRSPTFSRPDGSAPPPKASIKAAGPAFDNGGTRRLIVQPGGQSFDGKIISHPEHTGLEISQINVRAGIAPKPLGSSSVHFYPAARIEYV
jgi:hypothetical protein